MALGGLAHVADDDLAERRRDGVNLFHFEPGHGQLCDSASVEIFSGLAIVRSQDSENCMVSFLIRYRYSVECHRAQMGDAACGQVSGELAQEAHDRLRRTAAGR